MKRPVTLLIVLVAFALPVGDVQAQQPLQVSFSESNAVSQTDVKALLERLQAAEEKIKELEKKVHGEEKKKPEPKEVSSVLAPRGVEDFKSPDAKNNKKEKSILSRIKELEEQDKKDAKAFDELEEEVGDIGDRFKWSSDLVNFRLNGRIHMDYVNFFSDSAGLGFIANPDSSSDVFGQDPENRLVFRRLRLTHRGEIADNMFWKLDLEFADSTAQMRDALLGFSNLPLYNGRLIIGNQKRPISLDQLNSSNNNIFMERPLIADAFQEDSRRVGIQAFHYNDAETITWQYGFFDARNIATDKSDVNDAFQGQAIGRVTGLLFYDNALDGRNYMHLGLAGSVSGYDGDPNDLDTDGNALRFRARPELRTLNRFYDTGTIDFADYGYQQAAEFILNLGPFSLVAEYETDQITRTGGNDSLFFHGGYVYVNYFLTGEHMPYNRTDGKLRGPKPYENFFLVNRLCGKPGGGWGAFALAARYSYLDLSDDDIGGGEGHQMTLGLNWWWNQRTRLMMNYVYGDIRDRGPIGGQIRSGTFSALATRFAVFW